MKYVYVVLIIALVVGGSYAIFSHMQEDKDAGTSSAPQSSNAIMEASSTMVQYQGAPLEGQNDNVSMQESASQSVAQSEDPNAALTTDAKVFKIHASNYKFDVTQIQVKQGDTVTIDFASDSGIHDWAIDEFNAATQKVGPGTPTSVTFVADKTGTFEYYCSVGQHRAMGMVGKLIVE